MPRFCHNCGDPVEEGEVFCDKCGTRLESEEGTQNQYQSQGNLYYKNNYSNNMNNQNIEHQNVNQYSYTPMSPVNKPSKALKFAKIMSIIAGVGTLLIIILVVIATLISPPDNPPVGPKVTPVVTPVVTPANNNSNKALVAWLADLNSYATYISAEKKIDVDYSVLLKNTGTKTATDVKVYLDPVQNDTNANYIGIKVKTIVNYNESIASINAGATRDIKTKFYYDNIETSKATQPLLQQIAESYVKIPILIEWKEDGKVYTQNLTIQ